VTICLEVRRTPIIATGMAITRAAAEDDGARFTGHAAVFNSRTNIGNPLTWGFVEEIAPGAFTRTIAEADVRMLIDHTSQLIVARTSAGTLRLAQDRVGLAVDAELSAELSYVKDLKINLRIGNLDGMSFGFYVRADTWSTETVDTDAGPVEIEVRRITDVDLVEVSVVTFPAYPDTDAALRAQRPEVSAL
jgi:uncharacterized protein